jgi:hypothetical protein
MRPEHTCAQRMSSSQTRTACFRPVRQCAHDDFVVDASIHRPPEDLAGRVYGHVGGTGPQVEYCTVPLGLNLVSRLANNALFLLFGRVHQLLLQRLTHPARAFDDVSSFVASMGNLSLSLLMGSLGDDPTLFRQSELRFDCHGARVNRISHE